ncbi:hypothetical protein KM043_000963 [Ampulex compressa]|nr:hypothetical protein KM043_000963 [Ampulex compressa]
MANIARVGATPRRRPLRAAVSKRRRAPGSAASGELSSGISRGLELPLAPSAEERTRRQRSVQHRRGSHASPNAGPMSRNLSSLRPRPSSTKFPPALARTAFLARRTGAVPSRISTPLCRLDGCSRRFDFGPTIHAELRGPAAPCADVPSGTPANSCRFIFAKVAEKRRRRPPSSDLAPIVRARIAPEAGFGRALLAQRGRILPLASHPT